MKTNKESRRVVSEVKRLSKLRECGNADHLTNEDGSLKSEFPHGDGKYSLGYLEDTCQWLYYRTDLKPSDKLDRILVIESIIQHMLGELKYHPIWSIKQF